MIIRSGIIVVITRALPLQQLKIYGVINFYKIKS